MHHNNKKKLQKTQIKKITIEKGASNLTTHSGLIPVIKFLDSLQLENLLHNHFSLRTGNNVAYQVFDLVLMVTVGYIGGARSVSNIVSIWADTVLRKITGFRRIPDDSSIGRAFKQFKESDIYQFEFVNHALRQKVWKKLTRSGKSKFFYHSLLYIDVDSTVKTVFGKQQGAEKGFNSVNKGKLSYHPLIAFCVETKEILQGWMRCGSAYTSNGVVGFMEQLLFHMPNKSKIIFRGDSGFFNNKLMNLLEERGHGYLLKVKLKGLVGLLETQQWTPVKNQPGWEQCEFQHMCGTWNRSRRFVAVRQVNEEKTKSAQQNLFGLKEYDYYCYATTEELAPWRIHKSYGKRATCETWIEEAKNQMGMAQIKSNSFLATSAYFQCSILAYNTIRWMALLSNDEKLKKWEIQTVRTFLIRVAGKLLLGARQQKLKIPDDILYEKQWVEWIRFVE